MVEMQSIREKITLKQKQASAGEDTIPSWLRDNLAIFCRASEAINPERARQEVSSQTEIGKALWQLFTFATRYLKNKNLLDKRPYLSIYLLWISREHYRAVIGAFGLEQRFTVTCSKRLDRGDGAKRCEQKKNEGVG